MRPDVASALRDIGRAVIALADAVARDRVNVVSVGPDLVEQLIPHDQWEPSPLNETAGRRAARLRRWSERARRGEVRGAVRRGRSWWAPPSAITAFIRGEGPPAVAIVAPKHEEQDALVIQMRDAARRRSAGGRNR